MTRVTAAPTVIMVRRAAENLPPAAMPMARHGTAVSAVVIFVIAAPTSIATRMPADQSAPAVLPTTNHAPRARVATAPATTPASIFTPVNPARQSSAAALPEYFHATAAPMDAISMGDFASSFRVGSSAFSNILRPLSNSLKSRALKPFAICAKAGPRSRVSWSMLLRMAKIASLITMKPIARRVRNSRAKTPISLEPAAARSVIALLAAPPASLNDIRGPINRAKTLPILVAPSLRMTTITDSIAARRPR